MSFVARTWNGEFDLHPSRLCSCPHLAGKKGGIIKVTHAPSIEEWWYHSTGGKRSVSGFFGLFDHENFRRGFGICPTDGSTVSLHFCTMKRQQLHAFSLANHSTEERTVIVSLCCEWMKGKTLCAQTLQHPKGTFMLGKKAHYSVFVWTLRRTEIRLVVVTPKE